VTKDELEVENAVLRNLLRQMQAAIDTAIEDFDEDDLPEEDDHEQG
jgi:hypothetical protein